MLGGKDAQRAMRTVLRHGCGVERRAAVEIGSFQAVACEGLDTVVERATEARRAGGEVEVGCVAFGVGLQAGVVGDGDADMSAARTWSEAECLERERQFCLIISDVPHGWSNGSSIGFCQLV